MPVFDKEWFLSRIAPKTNPPSPRERAVWKMVAEGHSRKDIAAELGISVKTVDVQIAAVCGKIGARGIVDMGRAAIACGLVVQEVVGK